MTQPTGGEGRREGLFAASKNLLVTLLAIGKTRGELLVVEIEEEKFRLVSLLVNALGAVFLLALGIVMLVFCLALAFWEQRVLLFALLAAVFVGGGLLLFGALRRQAAQPSQLFSHSLAELEKDLARLRQPDHSA